MRPPAQAPGMDPNEFAGMTPTELAPPLAGLHELGLDAWARASIEVFPETIAEELCKAPGHMAYWSARYADAQRAHALAERDLDVIRAHKRQAFRVMLRDGKKQPTVGMVDDALELDEEYTAARVAVIETETTMLKAQGFARAVQAKKDTLMCLSAIVREEMRGDPAIKRLAENREEVMRGQRGG